MQHSVALCNLWHGVIEWYDGVVSWSGVLEWHVGIKFWSGKKSDFEFFVAIFFFITFTVNIHKTNYAPVICIPGAGDTGGIAG